ncbi:MAG: DNA repair protein RecO [Chitinispirillales bacterium]|jgi:DNA repair protein RecO|nr:DNA repair protein RecO [Chitinispirillales bacterium]
MEKVLKGIVLQYIHFGETSAILKTITKDNGICSVLLHGVKKHGGNYGIGAVVEWQISKRYLEKNTLPKTSKYDIVENYSFGSDINKIAMRDCAFELILQVVPQENGDTFELYNLLEKYMKYLKKSDSEIFFGFWLFCIRFAKFLGYEIDLQNCINCSNILTDAFLSKQNGGFLCIKCHPKPNWKKEILTLLSKGGLEIYEKMQNIPIKEKILITGQLISYIQFHCGREKKLNSFDFFCGCLSLS